MGYARKVLNWYAKLSPSRGFVAPPYKHVVQIGDPILRSQTSPVPLDKLKSKEIQSVLAKIRYVINKYDSVGMSAPQIGVNLRIFAMQHTQKQLSKVPEETIGARGMSVVPYTVFINPHIKVVDFRKVTHPEGCESVRGFTALVPRFKEVEVQGYNEDGIAINIKFKDWAARIAQHEMDHLNGKIYTDIMEPKTLECTCWQEVNLSQGKLAIPFSPE